MISHRKPASTPADFAIVVGFAAEARIARMTGRPAGIGGGTSAGALAAARALIAGGARGLVSFGLAGGLDPALPAGRLIVPARVIAGGRSWSADAGLAARFGGLTGQTCLAVDRIVDNAAEKQRLGRETGAALADMESGAVAKAATEAGIPFAIVRAICDPAGMDLPPAALVALDTGGRVAPARLMRSLLSNPGQIGALLRLARGTMAARRALIAVARM